MLRVAWTELRPENIVWPRQRDDDTGLSATRQSCALLTLSHDRRMLQLTFIVEERRLSWSRPAVDLRRVRVRPLAERRSLASVEETLVDPNATPAAAIDEVAARIRQARSEGASVMLVYGALLVPSSGLCFGERHRERRHTRASRIAPARLDQYHVVAPRALDGASGYRGGQAGAVRACPPPLLPGRRSRSTPDVTGTRNGEPAGDENLEQQERT
jgi:hypothetical protein